MGIIICNVINYEWKDDFWQKNVVVGIESCLPKCFFYFNPQVDKYWLLEPVIETFTSYVSFFASVVLKGGNYKFVGILCLLAQLLRKWYNLNDYCIFNRTHINKISKSFVDFAIIQNDAHNISIYIFTYHLVPFVMTNISRNLLDLESKLLEPKKDLRLLPPCWPFFHFSFFLEKIEKLLWPCLYGVWIS